METDTNQSDEEYSLRPVSVEGFEGPLDLLLSLIEKGKFDVSRISLANVTDQYLVRIREGNNIPPEHLADFLVVAATLLLLKSKKLFPELELTEEEEEQVESLEEQLREYQRFRAAAKQFMSLWNEGRVMYARKTYTNIEPSFYPPPSYDIATLSNLIGSVVLNLPKMDVIAEGMVKRIISIEERIKDFQERIGEKAKISFKNMAKSKSSKREVIVSFLALLELVKQKFVSVEQRQEFEDILIERRTNAEKSSQ